MGEHEETIIQEWTADVLNKQRKLPKTCHNNNFHRIFPEKSSKIKKVVHIFLKFNNLHSSIIKDLRLQSRKLTGERNDEVLSTTCVLWCHLLRPLALRILNWYAFYTSNRWIKKNYLIFTKTCVIPDRKSLIRFYGFFFIKNCYLSVLVFTKKKHFIVKTRYLDKNYLSSFGLTWYSILLNN